MSASQPIKTHKGAELNLEHYKGVSVVDFVFELLDDESAALDLTVYSNIKLVLFHKRNGTEVDSFDYNSGLTVTDNLVTWNQSITRSGLYRIGLTYYHHCYGVLDGGQHDLLFYGNSEIR